jgi:hypothetical protein
MFGSYQHRRVETPERLYRVPYTAYYERDAPNRKRWRPQESEGLGQYPPPRYPPDDALLSPEELARKSWVQSQALRREDSGGFQSPRHELPDGHSRLPLARRTTAPKPVPELFRLNDPPPKIIQPDNNVSTKLRSAIDIG